MVSVLLTLLKMIGIMLLVLLCLILGLILLVIFVPARYRLKGYYKEEFVVHGKITWLLHFVSVSIDYDKEPVTFVKILGIPLDRFLNKRKNSPSKEESDTDTGKAPDSKKENDVPEITDTQFAILNENSSDIQEEIITETAEDKTIGNKSIFRKIKSYFNEIKKKIKNIYQKICDFIAKIKDIFFKIKSGNETIANYISILKRDDIKQAYSLCIKRIWKFIKHILPKKMKVNLNVGFDDPATTGYVLAGYSILPPTLSRKFILHTDFNKQIFEFDFNIKGHVTAWNLLYQIICLVLNKNCQSLYQFVKKEISNERK